MRTLCLTPSFWPALGGLESYCGHLIHGLRRAGHDILVVTNDAAHWELPTGMQTEDQVERLPIYAALTQSHPAQLLQIQRHIHALADAYRPDLVHLHLVGAVPMALFALHLHQREGYPLLATVHDDVQGAAAGGDSLLGKCLAAASWVTTASPTFLADVQNLMPSLAATSSAIEPGVPLPSAAQTPFDRASTQFLMLGRVVRDKGMDIAIDALAQVLPTAPTARLVIAGVGRAIPELQAKVAAMGLEAHVHFAGAVSDAERTRLIDASLAVLMPSRWREGFGVVAVEAAHRARPVIAAQAGALGETVTQLTGGIVLATNDAKALATAMQQFLHDPDTAMRLGAQGRQQAECLFNVDRFITRYDALYRQIVEGQ